MFRRVAIIGGGAAAATLIGELLERRPPHPLHLDWYTGGDKLARGVAYGTGSERHLLNVRAASMSMFAGKPRGFLDFVQRDDAAIAGTDFLPRRRYGDYLEAEVAHALEQGRAHGHDVHVIPFAVDALVPERDSVTVIHGEESHQVDAAVLALGTMPPRPLNGVTEAALASGRYVVDPWKLLADTGIDPPPRTVVVIGLGLTAVDVLLELSARWPQTQFIAISRHGLLPEAHLHAAAAPTGDSAELIESMRDAPEIRHWLHLLREAIAQDPTTDWRTIIDSLRPQTASLWRGLPAVERGRFLRHIRPYWDIHRHRMAPPAAELVDRLRAGGTLRVLRGRIREVQPGAGLAIVQYDSCPSGRRETLAVQRVIYATGLQGVRASGGLVAAMLASGQARLDGQELGLDVTQGLNIIDGDGKVARNLWALGPIVRGTFWECLAVPDIRQQADQLAREVVSALAPASVEVPV